MQRDAQRYMYARVSNKSSNPVALVWYKNRRESGVEPILVKG